MILGPKDQRRDEKAHEVMRQRQENQEETAKYKDLSRTTDLELRHVNVNVINRYGFRVRTGVGGQDFSGFMRSVSIISATHS